MAFVSVKVIKDLLTDEQKVKIQSGITDVMTSVIGEDRKNELKQNIWVVIEEIQDKNWSFGGEAGSLELLNIFTKDL
ncbi:tautomerase family protein [Desulfocicer niacini]